MIFDSISSNIDEVLSINPSADVFVCLSLETLMFIIRTDLPVLVELINLVNYVIIFLSQMTLFKWVTFLLRSQIVILTVLLFCIYFFLLTLVFVLQWLSLHQQILIMLMPQFPLTFHHNHNGIPHCIAMLMATFVLIGMVFMIIWEMFHWMISLNSVLLLLLVNFVSGFRLESMYICLLESIRSSLSHLNGFQLLVLLAWFIEITYFVCT